MKEVLIRTATGIIFILVVIGSVLIHQLAFAAVLAVFLIISVNEWIKLCSQTQIHLNAFIVYGLSVMLFLSFVLSSIFNIPFIPIITAALIIPISALFIMITAGKNVLANTAILILSILYLSLPMGLLVTLHDFDSKWGRGFFVIVLFVIIWSYDTFAYVTGKLIGKHKLFERISPAKTWEGVIGGTVLTVVLLLLVNNLFYDIDVIVVSGAAITIIVSSTIGDLFESALKRNAGLKDSGNLFPGHGGMLDRFDSVYFSVVPYIIYIFLTMYSIN